MRQNLIFHLHPKTVDGDSIRFNRTFGLGGMAALLIVVQVITGILLRFYYSPNVAEAYNSVMFLQTQVLFGAFVRNIHYWGGAFLLLIVFLHLLRVFFTGAYRDKRKVNWLFGLCLVVVVVFSNFTGYLLPWDQLSYWAVTVSTNIIGYFPLIGESLRVMIIGGEELNAGTLQTFFTFHTAVLPFLLVLISVYHFWRVRKAGGVLVPGSGKKPNLVPVMPNLVHKELVVGLVLLAALFLISALIHAPLLEKANPAFSMNPTKAPWYFAGVQELLMHFHPFFAAFLIPAVVIAFFAWIPFLKYDESPGGHWFISGKGKQSTRSTAIFAAIVTLAGVLFNEYVLSFEILLPAVPAVISNGIIPLAILGIFMATFYRFYLRSLKLSKEETVQVAFVFIIAAFIVLTIVGEFFRGKDMQLTL